jgi:hypothetical protein
VCCRGFEIAESRLKLLEASLLQDRSRLDQLAILEFPIASR